MNLPFFIARRYLFAKKSHNVINIISAISAIGMAIGTAALIIILSVYNGFDGLIRSSLSDLEPDYLIVPSKGKVFVPEGPAFEWACSAPEVYNMCEVLQESVFLNYDGSQCVARARGVDKVYEEETLLKNHIRAGEFKLRNGDVYMCSVSSDLASELKLNPTFVTPLQFYYPRRGQSVSMSNPMASLQTASLRPSSVFAINSESASNLVILPLGVMRTLLGYESGEVSSVELRLSKGLTKSETKVFRTKLEDLLGNEFILKDRIQQNTSLYKMMRYEKASIFLILIFVIIIIAFNIFGSLSMLIIDKKTDIEIFRSMGAEDKLIRHFFVLEGWMISLLGLAAGLVIGITVSFIQQKYGIITLPGNYTVSSYPVILKLSDVLMTSISVSLIGYLIALIPSSRFFHKR